MKRISKAKLAVTIASGIVAFVASAIAIYEFGLKKTVIDLTGTWIIRNTVLSTKYTPYQGLTLGYRISFQQTGTRLIGDGEKWWENEQEVSGKAHTPIHMEGTVEGDNIRATFTEQGARRQTSGYFE